MKHVKHLLVAALTVFLAAVLAVPAFAADATHSISLSDGDTHTYTVYQVLTGTMANEGDTNLGDPKWGADATDEAKEGEVQTFINSLKGKTDEQVAAAVAAVVDTSGEGRGTVSKGSPITNLPTGYYVLVDKTSLTGDHANDTKALNVVQVVNNIEGLAIKWDTTSDDKIITSDTLGTDNETKDNHAVTGDGKTDNVSIGDTVNYQITAKIPAKASNYNYFYFIINDTLSEGLTFTDGSIKVYKDSVAEGNLLTAGADKDYQVKTSDIGTKTFEVALNDAKSLAGKNIIVTYSAVLNDNAKIGDEANPNTSTVTFSNDPNHNYDGDNHPGFPSTEDLKVTGETPDSVTNTYTTGIEIQKVDENGKVLTGAEFTITGDSTEIVLVSSEAFAEATAADGGEYYKLKNNTYTKDAPVTADKMEEAAAGATAGYVEDASYTGEDKVEVGGKTYRPYAPDTDSGKTVYILVKANSDQYESTETLYKKTITYTQKNTTKGTTAKVEVGADGVARFVGLGAGTYTITESKTPAGYNTLDPVNVTIAFTASPTGENSHWSKTTGDATYDKADGVFKITIENQKGSTLPETGGMGTTILYTVGGIMVIAGIVMFLTKRRMASIEK